MGKEFANDFLDRGIVKITDMLLIHNIDTGVTEYTTVYQLLAALAIYGNIGIGTTVPGGKLEINMASVNAQGAIRLLSGNAANYVSYGLGRTALEFDIGVAAVIDNWATGSAIGDIILTLANDKKLHIGGFAGGAAPLVISSGKIGIGTVAPTSKLHVVGIPIYANNAAALLGGLTAGAFYRTNADPDPICVVH